MILEYQIDPLNKYSHISEYDLTQMLGYIPGWAANGEFLSSPLQEALDKQYGFGLFEMTGGKVLEDGTFVYPGDPDLYPLFKLIRDKETLYQYPSAIVIIIKEDGTSFCTRMD